MSLRPNLLTMHNSYKTIWFFFICVAIVLGSFLISESQSHGNTHASDKPLIVFIPGLGYTPEDYTYILDSLRKEHYVVVGFNPEYEIEGDKEVIIDAWNQQLRQTIGDEDVIVIGHSIGGETAIAFCSTSPHCLAGISLDGGANTIYDISVPFLYIQAQSGSYCDNECEEGREQMQATIEKSQGSMVVMNSIKHYNFLDHPTVEMIQDGDATPKSDHKTIISYIISFLNNAL